ncbi:hypothetical protein DXG01_012153 [Tephrocybe rancida]|nr:hypothetical protein DXG01_012153 [Tephrocybe rancida]
MVMEFLLNELPIYKQAIVDGCAADALTNTQCRYLKCFPPDLPLNQDLSPEALAAVNDFAADTERPPLPDRSMVGDAIYETAVEVEEEHKAKVVKLKNQIQGFMQYQYAKSCELSPHDTGAFDPCAIEQVPQFVAPILHVLKDITGWKWLLQGSGPEPADGGRLNVMILSSGSTLGDVGLMFTQAQHENYNKFMLLVWGTSFESPDKFHARAVPEPGLCISQLREVENVIITTIEGLPSNPLHLDPLTTATTTVTQPMPIQPTSTVAPAQPLSMSVPPLAL